MKAKEIPAVLSHYTLGLTSGLMIQDKIMSNTSIDGGLVQNTLEGIIQEPTGQKAAMGAGTIVALEGTRQLMKWTGRKREKDDAKPVKDRHYAFGKQFFEGAVYMGLTLAALNVADNSVIQPMTEQIMQYGHQGLDYLVQLGNQTLDSTVQGLAVGAAFLGNGALNAWPIVPAKKEAVRTYKMRIHNEGLAHTTFVDAKRFMLNFLPTFNRSKYKRFTKDTIFGATITSKYKNKKTKWFLTYQSDMIKKRKRKLTVDDLTTFLDGIEKIEASQNHDPAYVPNLSSREFGSEVKSILKKRGIDKDIFGDNLSLYDMQDLSKTLNQTGCDNVFTLGLDSKEDQDYHSRLEQVVDHTNHLRLKTGGQYQIKAWRVGNKTSNRFFTYTLNPRESIRITQSNGRKLTPSDLLLHVGIRGGTGGHDSHEMNEDLVEVEDLDFGDHEDHDSGYSGATTQDCITQILKGTEEYIDALAGAVYEIQIGDNNYRIHTSVAEGIGKGLARISNIYLDPHENGTKMQLIARKEQSIIDAVPRTLNKAGLGWETTYLHIYDHEHADNQKFAATILGHDLMQSHEPRVRRQIAEQTKPTEIEYRPAE